MAYDAGLSNIAEASWAKAVPNVVGMPSLKEFREGYVAHANAFARFETGAVNEKDPHRRVSFVHEGTPFSNAAGSYAFALDVAARGDAALCGGEREWVASWGAEALEAAGFVQQAKQLQQAIASGALLETQKHISPTM